MLMSKSFPWPVSQLLIKTQHLITQVCRQIPLNNWWWRFMPKRLCLIKRFFALNQFYQRNFFNRRLMLYSIAGSKCEGICSQLSTFRHYFMPPSGHWNWICWQSRNGKTQAILLLKTPRAGKCTVSFLLFAVIYTTRADWIKLVGYAHYVIKL